MRIAQIAPLFERVPPQTYGGTERVVHVLTEQLVRRGHEVTLFASGDSRTSARLIPCARQAVRIDPEVVDAIALHLAMLACVGRQQAEFDIIHNHVGYPIFPFLPSWTTPVVTTLHGRQNVPELQPFYREFREPRLISISDSQREPLAHFGLNWEATVYNGIAIENFDPVLEHGRYLVFVGRVSPEKRPDLAIEVAKRAGMPIKIAAKIDRVDQDWAREHFLPLTGHPLVDFIGEVDEPRKNELLGRAFASLMPIQWPEPFGLAMTESLACGTPVIAFRFGAVPEIIRDGVTGFIVDTLDEMVEAVERVHTIDRAVCREDVVARFSADAMTDGYEAVYRRVAFRERFMQRLLGEQALDAVTAPGLLHDGDGQPARIGKDLDVDLLVAAGDAQVNPPPADLDSA